MLLELNPDRDTQTNPACKAVPRRAVQQEPPENAERNAAIRASLTLLVTSLLLSHEEFVLATVKLEEILSVPVVSITYLS